MEVLPGDIRRLTKELLHSDLLADFQVKMIQEWHDECMAQPHMRHTAEAAHLHNIGPNLIGSEQLLWEPPDSVDLISRGNMAQAVSLWCLLVSRHQLQAITVGPSGSPVT